MVRQRSSASRGSFQGPKRKRLEVTSSRLDSISTQIEQEAGIQQEPAPDKQKTAKKKQQKKTRQEVTRLRMKSDQAKGPTAARPGAGPSETQQLVERKRQLRDARRRRGALRRVSFFLLVIIVVGAVIFGCNYAVHSSLVRVTAIQVTGTSLLTQSEVTTLAAIPSTASVPLLNTGRIEDNLKRDAWIQSAQVTRKLPHQVTLHITERAPLVFVDDGTGASKGWLVSRDGVWLGAYAAKTGMVARTTSPQGVLILPATLRDSIITVTDVENVKATTGEAVKDAGVKNALAIVTGISPELRGQIKTISAPDVVGTTVYLKSGIEVDIGAADHIAYKDTIIRQILKDQAGKVILINVCTYNKPTWRGLDSAE